MADVCVCLYVSVCYVHRSYKVHRDLSEHERSVEKYDAKQSVSQHFSSVLANTQVLYNCTQHSRQVFYFFNKIQIIEKFCACCGQL
jgi:hypothetical protein